MTRLQGFNDSGVEMRGSYVMVETDYSTDCSCDGMTRQEFADECDINVLMSRYEKSGVLNHYNGAEAAYLDLSDVPDLATAFDIFEKANTAFMSLPAAVRREFENDPVRFADFAADPANVDKMREWKLAAPAPVEPGPTKVEIVNPPESGSSGATK
ncbi:minor capsid protein [Capybara microvirus Cap1_SP_228]|nr:minor capsid protein [Capybara microvirus Cap1_SP_228]